MIVTVFDIEVRTEARLFLSFGGKQNNYIIEYWY